MIPSNTVNLPICALGAGVAHAAALALVLPLMITLPAAGEGNDAKLVTIPVEIVTTAPASVTATPDLIGALMTTEGEGDADPDPADDLAAIPADAPAADDAVADESPPDVTAALPEDITGALPDPSLTEDRPAPDGDLDAAADELPQEEPDPEPVADEVANVDAVTPPLPLRVRRDETGDAIVRAAPAPAPAPAARAPVHEPAPAAKPVRRAAPAPKRGLFGLAQPRPAATARSGDAAPYKGSWDALLGKPAH